MNTDSLVKILWDYHHLNHKLKKCDAILVLGSQDIRVAEYAAKLFLDGLAPILIFSGGKGRMTETWTQSEAEVFAEIAEKMGVPRTNMILENKSTNTGENILFTKKLLKEKNLDIKNFLLIQKPYMERRAYATFKKIYPDLEPIVSSPPIPFEEYPTDPDHRERVINTVVGDTQRIKIYADMGFMIPQEMPEEVLSAYKELAKRGYDKQMLS